ncbi:MAG: UDP-N-acetylglucosamine 1-carboxyvinyltransferase [Clostridia bacterium]|nr:UDP-N-acetylglucosamine 1-carboxyvinyltransferase [Oscillospiraceae bacterium]MBQ7959815.1 UDP-N-acetylglucosamine 1-carboxyvinyltransferase [Clostridia bacterium]
MEKYVILGGARLEGEVEISGAKNSAVALIVAALMVDGVCIIENVPLVSDTYVLVDIINQLGGRAEFVDKSVLKIDASCLECCEAPYEMVRKIRASSYLMGALLGRFQKAKVAMPGGCDFGVRPIDLHLKGFEALGADYSVEAGGIVDLRAEELCGASIYMDTVSVGATINIMFAAAMAKGQTIIENAAKEPHIVDVANFLNSMGANIKGAGTDVIKIKGVKSLHGGTYTVIPDQIEAGTFMIAAAATDGDVLIKNVIPKHLDSISAKLLEMGVVVEEFDDSIRVAGTGFLKKANVRTMPHPGFPTDLQPLILTLLTGAKGTSIVTENVWDNRFRYVEELRRMGANVSVDGRIAVIEGGGKLIGSPVSSTDLRAGAALVVAGLMADGVTEVFNIKYIDRGYEEFEKKLRGLGAQITRRVDGEKGKSATIA